jgi:hypothetical protein
MFGILLLQGNLGALQFAPQRGQGEKLDIFSLEDVFTSSYRLCTVLASSNTRHRSKAKPPFLCGH